jgi:fumarylacetoacetase
MRSFIPIEPDSHFPLQNIPFGIFNIGDGIPRPCTRIGDMIIDLNYLEEAMFFVSDNLVYQKYFSSRYLNEFMAAGKNEWSRIRAIIQNLFREDNPTIRDNPSLKERALILAKEVEMCLPVDIGDYTDFYSSREHAANVGIMFRGKENALMPNWLHLPIAYHGRSSSIVISGTGIIRPKGQLKPKDSENPVFGPTKLLDFELEMGFFIGKGNKLGHPINVNKAIDHIFGMVIVNDWSARDIQTWEYQPLGPFLAKNFATSISPWVVTMEALEPFRTNSPEPELEILPYLQSSGNNSYDINLEVLIKTDKLDEPFNICTSNHKYLYWNIEQQLAHHTVNGCNTRTGDLMASGTISGPDKDSYGSMLELSWRGEKPLKLPSGEERKFIEDNDEIIMTAYCQAKDHRIGFGEVKGRIIPALK